MSKKKVVAISGSTRQNSTNDSLIKAIADLSAEIIDITIFNGIANLPQFNPDNDGDELANKTLVDCRPVGERQLDLGSAVDVGLVFTENGTV